MKNQVSLFFFNFINQKKDEVELELQIVHRNSREYLENGHKTNPEMALEEQLQDKLRRAKSFIRECVAVSNPKDNETVQIGSTVKVLINNKTEETLRLEGTANYFNFLPRVCSLKSSVGQKLFKAKKGDCFSFRGIVYEILEIGS